jgi:alpha-1,6-mannosyltransferase
MLLDRGLASRRGAVALVLGFAGLFQLTLLLIPGVYSTDVFSYLAYAQLGGTYGLNPYLHSPSTLVNDPLVEQIYAPWRALPSPYGPLWTTISVELSRLYRGLSLEQQLVTYELFTSLLHLINLGLVWLLLERCLPANWTRGARLTGFALFAWNPVILFELVGNGHNDGLMITFMLAALLALSLPRASGINLHWLAAGALLTLSILVKYATLPLGVIGAFAWASELPSWRMRFAWLLGASLIVGAIVVVAFQPWYAGPATMSPLLNEFAGKFNDHDRSTHWLLHRMIGGLPGDLVIFGMPVAAAAWFEILGGVVFVAYLVWELRQTVQASSTDRVYTIARAAARMYLVTLLLVASQVHTWYFVWPLSLVPLLGWRSVLTRMIVVYALSGLVLDYAYVAIPLEIQPLSVVGYLILPLLVPLVGPLLRSEHRLARSVERYWPRLWTTPAPRSRSV